MSDSFRAAVEVNIDRERLIDECLEFVRRPTAPQSRRAVAGGPIPRDLLEVLALEGGTRRADVARVVALLDGVRWMARWDYAA